MSWISKHSGKHREAIFLWYLINFFNISNYLTNDILVWLNVLKRSLSRLNMMTFVKQNWQLLFCYGILLNCINKFVPTIILVDIEVLLYTLVKPKMIIVKGLFQYCSISNLTICIWNNAACVNLFLQKVILVFCRLSMSSYSNLLFDCKDSR